MVKVDVGGQNFYLNDFLRDNLDFAKKKVKQDWDMVGIVDGREGSGKSVCAQQIAKYCDPEFNLDHIVFTPEQFKKAIRGAKETQAIVYDEAYGGLGARGTMSQINIAIVKMLTEIRSKRLFLFVVLPTFFDLDKYVALSRSRFLLHVYTDDNWNRGHFGFYGEGLKKYLYMMGKKTYSYKTPDANFHGRFVNYYTVDKKKYLAKKMENAYREIDEKRLMALKITKEVRSQITESLEHSDLNLTKRSQAAIMGVTEMTIHNYLKERGVNSEESTK